MIWLEAHVVERFIAMRRPGESYSDVILQLVEIEAGNHAR
jgi:predicted CopG family antitoxin